MRFDLQKYLIGLFDNPLGRWYLGVPKGKRIYKITPYSVHYYTGELSKRNGLPVICTGSVFPGSRRKPVYDRITKLVRAVSWFAFLPFFPSSLLPLVALANSLKYPGSCSGNEGGCPNLCAVGGGICNYQYINSYCTGSSYGFSIPSASIDGIYVTIPPSGGTYANSSMWAKLSWDGGSSWTAEKGGAGVFYYGGSTDTWGRSWTTTEINSSNFWCNIRCSNCNLWPATFDYTNITVYYTEITGPTGVKTINDTAIASVKTVNDTAIASVKTING